METAHERLLGIDFGSRRVGVALSDALGIAAHPHLTLGGGNPRQLLKDLHRVVKKHSVTAIVVGHPLHMSGDVSPQAAKAQQFAQTLRDTFALPVHLHDERLSSVAAHELLDAAGHPRGAAREAILDQWSAAVILQGWMDIHPAPKPPQDASSAAV